MPALARRVPRGVEDQVGHEPAVAGEPEAEPGPGGRVDRVERDRALLGADRQGPSVGREGEGREDAPGLVGGGVGSIPGRRAAAMSMRVTVPVRSPTARTAPSGRRARLEIPSTGGRPGLGSLARSLGVARRAGDVPDVEPAGHVDQVEAVAARRDLDGAEADGALAPAARAGRGAGRGRRSRRPRRRRPARRRDHRDQPVRGLAAPEVDGRGRGAGP